MKPMFKYRGGKSKEIDRFINNMPKDYSGYIEPFLGGGALYFHLQPDKAIVNDINFKLFSFYKEMQKEYPLARKQLDKLQKIYEENQTIYERLKKQHPEEKVENKNEILYYLMRDAFNHKIETEYLGAVVYFFINKTAYSGMIRYNANGEYNVPFGRYKNIFLSESEYAELKEEYPDRLERLIEEMSEFIAATGNDYVCHAAALRRWLNREKKENPKKGIPDYSYKEGESL